MKIPLMGNLRWLLPLIAAVTILADDGHCGQTETFMSPPRTIADITAILDQEKPDSTLIAGMRAQADAEPPQNVEAAGLLQFYYLRAVARSNLGRFRDAIADAKTVIDFGVR